MTGRLELCSTTRGLGPAIITSTTLAIDGEVAGVWNLPNCRKLREHLLVWPRLTVFNHNDSVSANREVELFVLPEYDRELHSEFWDLISDRMYLKISYESLYGESFSVELVPSDPDLI